jgi:hypothetical protein
MAIQDVAAKAVKMLVPTSVLRRLSPKNEPANLARTAVASTIQSALSSCEAGDPKQLFQLYRDMTTGGSHVLNEFNKRKLSVLGDTLNIVPADKAKPEDVLAAECFKRATEDCENWLDGLMFLSDSAAIHPLSIVEMIFRPVDRAGDDASSPIPAYTLRKLSPVNYSLLTFKQHSDLKVVAKEQDYWEPNARIFPVDADGKASSRVDDAYLPDPQRHIVHRGHMLVGVVDKWGGPGRSVLAWWYLAQLGRDWFGRYMERFGTPFPVGKTNTNDAQAISLLETAFATASKIGGLVVSSGTEIELVQAATSGAADAYERFLGVCNREISKVIVGQELSSTAAPTGLGSGVADLQGQVRNDIRIWDQRKLSDTLCKQLVKRFMFVNALKGTPPKLMWGSLDADESTQLGALLVSLNTAGLQPTDEALPQISEKVGFELERKEVPEPLMPGGAGSDSEDSAGKIRAYSVGGLPYSLSQKLLAESKGVPPSWLNPVAQELRRLEGILADQRLTDQEVTTFLELAATRMPELFSQMDIDAAAKSVEAGMVREVVDAARRNIRKVRK